MPDVVIRRFDVSDERRKFEKGYFDLVQIGGMTLGHAVYEPGWKWSTHVGAATGAKYCDVEHVGIVVSGRNRIQMRDGREYDLRAGDIFYVAPGHDSWVVGNEPYVSIHLMGAGDYASSKR
jgi:quercetin dioxygenase-like cupin family protein